MKSNQAICSWSDGYYTARINKDFQLKWTRSFYYGDVALFVYKVIESGLGNIAVLTESWDHLNGNNKSIEIIGLDSLGGSRCLLDSVQLIPDSIPLSMVDYPIIEDTCFASEFSVNPLVNRNIILEDKCSTVQVEYIDEKNIIDVYPNPSTGRYFIKSIDPVSEIKIFNLLGKIIYQSSTINSDSEIDLTNQPRGIYFCNIISKDLFGQTIKIILQ